MRSKLTLAISLAIPILILSFIVAVPNQASAGTNVISSASWPDTLKNSSIHDVSNCTDIRLTAGLSGSTELANYNPVFGCSLIDPTNGAVLAQGISSTLTNLINSPAVGIFNNGTALGAIAFQWLTLTVHYPGTHVMLLCYPVHFDKDNVTFSIQYSLYCSN